MVDELEHRILTRLRDQLSRKYKFILREKGMFLAGVTIPDLNISLVEDRDSLHNFCVSYLDRNNQLTVESFALDEFDRLVAFCDGCASR